MRVLLVSNMFPSPARPFGGTFVSRRVEALTARGHQVRPVGVRTVSTGVLALADRARGRPSQSPAPVPPFEDYLLPVGLRRRLRRGLDTSRLPATRALADLVRREGVDLVHGHGMYLFPAGSVARDVAALAGVPYVVSVHGQDVHTFMRGRVPHYREVLEQAAAVVSVSEDLAAAVRAAAPGARLQVIPNGYDPDTFAVAPGGPRDGDVAERPTEGRRRSTVLFVGNLEPVKGADRLPQLLRAVRALRPGAELDVVGSGSLAGRLRSQLPADGARLHGQVSPADVAARMRAADVLVLPSRSEGWPTVITEAYACGLPVVGLDVGGVAEAVRDPAHVVPADAGVEGLARAAVAVLDERPSRREVAAWAQGRTWADVARQEERIYQEALGGPRP